MKVKKIIAIGLSIGALSISFTGCIGTKASSLALSDANSKAAFEVIAKTEHITSNNLRFPTILGSDFFECENDVNCIKPNSFLVNDVYLEDASAKQNRQYSKNAYKGKYYNRENLKTNRGKIDNHIQNVDDLYLIAADIHAANVYIEKLKTDVKINSTNLKNTTKKIKDSRRSFSSKDFSEFTSHSNQFKRNLGKLKNERNDVSKVVRTIPYPSDLLIGNDVLNNKYKIILAKMTNRIETLEAINKDLTNMSTSLNNLTNAGNVKYIGEQQRKISDEVTQEKKIATATNLENIKEEETKELETTKTPRDNWLERIKEKRKARNEENDRKMAERINRNNNKTITPEINQEQIHTAVQQVEEVNHQQLNVANNTQQEIVNQQTEVPQNDAVIAQLPEQAELVVNEVNTHHQAYEQRLREIRERIEKRRRQTNNPSQSGYLNRNIVV